MILIFSLHGNLMLIITADKLTFIMLLFCMVNHLLLMVFIVADHMFIIIQSHIDSTIAEIQAETESL